MNNRKMLINGALVSCALALSASSVPARAGYGFCSEPDAPHLFARQPSKPFCASSHNCTSMDVDTYRREIDRYFDELKAYLSDVDRYRSSAYDYAKCMADFG